MKNVFEDECNVVLKMLLNKLLDFEDKLRVEFEGSTILGNINVDGYNGYGSYELLLEVFNNDKDVSDCEENIVDKDFSVDVMG